MVVSLTDSTPDHSFQVAVDNLVSGLVSMGVSVARVGQPAKVAPHLLATTLDALAEATAAGAKARDVRAKASKAAAGQAGALWQQALGLELDAAQQALDAVDVVAATCIGAGAWWWLPA